MPKAGRNIYKRKDGRWEGRYKVDNNGRKKYISVYGKTCHEVKEKLSSLQQELSVQHNSLTEYTTQLLLSTVLKYWLDSIRPQIKASTQWKYQFLIDTHINPELGDVPVSELSAILINKYLNNKLLQGKINGNGGLSTSYVTSIMLIIRSAIQFAANEKYCSPLNVSIVRPVKNSKRCSVLKREEQLKLENNLLKELTPTGLGVLLSLNTGLRIGEICALQWSDINLDENVLYVRHTVSRVANIGREEETKTKWILDVPKTKTSEREIPIPSKMQELLVKMKTKSVSDFVISEKKGFLNPRTYDYRFHKLLRKYNIKDINYHTLRHSFATRCIEVGVDVKSLSEILGHANVGITLNIYVHSSLELKRIQLEKLNNLNDRF